MGDFSSSATVPRCQARQCGWKCNLCCLSICDNIDPPPYSWQVDNIPSIGSWNCKNSALHCLCSLHTLCHEQVELSHVHITWNLWPATASQRNYCNETHSCYCWSLYYQWLGKWASLPAHLGGLVMPNPTQKQIFNYGLIAALIIQQHQDVP